MIKFAGELGVNVILLNVTPSLLNDELKQLIMVIIVRLIFMVVEYFWKKRKK